MIMVVQVETMRAGTHLQCVKVEMSGLLSFLPSLNAYSGTGTMSVIRDTNVKPQDLPHLLTVNEASKPTPNHKGTKTEATEVPSEAQGRGV